MKQESAQNGGKEEGDKQVMEGKMKRDHGDAGDSDDESPGAALLVAKKAKLGANRQCPYLDTIDRGVLDFDFEKLCSVSLSRINCYACLVCGKYFQVLFPVRQTATAV